MNIVFFGTSEVAAHFFEHLADNPRHKVAAAVTPTDRPSGRGMKICPPPVKASALVAGIKIYQPDSLSSADFADGLRAISPDLGVVVSYGKLIPRVIFEIPRFGCVNVHFSLLPRYRGAAPIQWSLINGESETGASVFFIEEKLDAGPIAAQRRTAIADEDDFFALRDKLISEGKAALDDAIAAVESGSLRGRPQSGEPSFAPALKKSDGKIDWRNSATTVRNLIRGALRWPTAFALLPDGRALKILKSEVVRVCAGSDGKCPSRVSPGMVTGMVKGEGFIVACGEEFLKISEVRPENGVKMTAWAFAQGRGVKAGDALL
ncbi:MAG: methionyl-tRNA formyltransferase [Endomicrobiia bacterium]|nr:methionyl-tRNA formyltransferase [Endomicrobiia bacterium]